MLYDLCVRRSIERIQATIVQLFTRINWINLTAFCEFIIKVRRLILEIYMYNL